MKMITKTLLSLAISTMSIGGAVGLGIAANNNKVSTEPMAAEAAITETTEYTYQFTNSKGWSNVYCYAWNTSGTVSDAWPGTQMSSSYTNDYSEKVYAVSFTSQPEKIIFTNGSKQTVDITVNSNNSFYLTGDGEDGSGKYNQIGGYVASFGRFYVLDLENKNLKTNHNIHMWGGIDGTSWPGDSMTKLTGATTLYRSKAIDSSRSVSIIINNGTGQTADIESGEMNKCYVLNSDWTYNVISLEAAKFIDEYMKFSTIPTSNEGHTASCAANYNAAKAAYNALSSNNVRKEVLSIELAKNRLQNWADANGGSLDVVNGTVLSSNSFRIADNSSATALIVLVCSSTLIGFAMFYFLNKKKEN